MSRTLVPWSRTHPTTRVFLAFREDEPVGIAVCIVGIRTFAARLLLDIPDLCVLCALRGREVLNLVTQAPDVPASARCSNGGPYKGGVKQPFRP